MYLKIMYNMYIRRRDYMKKYLVLLIVIATLMLSACSQEKDKSAEEDPSSSSQIVNNITKVEKPDFTKDTYPRIDGSTATIPLSESIASSILGMSKEEAAEFVKHRKTHAAYENLINGKADIIFVTEPSEEELRMARESKVELEIIPVVKEGFVFLVNTKNPINSLTTKQIQDLYQGKLTNWKKVGGRDSEIIAYQRNANSGSQTLMEQKVMKGLRMAEPPKETLIMDMGELIESIAKYDNSEKAIGYSVYYYAKSMYSRDTIKLIAVDGVEPDNKSISSGKYPFTTAYYAVLRKSDAVDAPSRRLLNWLLGADGQKVAESSGYVPLNMR
jgi:phosphate transport system substrate-binding protein